MHYEGNKINHPLMPLFVRPVWCLSPDSNTRFS
jgi:hypothetical protein